MLNGHCIYLDYQATTPVDPRVASAMSSCVSNVFGNPHSEHSFGWQAASAIEEASRHVANLIGADTGEIIFTSGATEANNNAIQGIACNPARRGSHILTSAIEHKSVLNTVFSLRKFGCDVELIPASNEGLIDAEQIVSRLKDNTALVSLGMVNNEIGTIQPVAEIAALCRERGIVMHTDASQAVGKIPVNVAEINVDLMSFSGHKIYGPKGIGVLYISRHCPIKLEPLILGGGQQRGLRAGTIPTFLCAGLGEACRIAREELDNDRESTLHLRDSFLSVLHEHLDDLVINGTLEQRIEGNLNIQLPGVDAEDLLSSLQGRIAASTGSACNTGLMEPSHVLSALNLSLNSITSSIRIGFGRFLKKNAVETAAELIAEKVKVSHRRQSSILTPAFEDHPVREYASLSGSEA